MAALAAERDQELGATLGAAHAREPVFEQAAVEEAADRRARRRAQGAVCPLEALFVHALECGVVVGEHAIQRGRFGAARVVRRGGRARVGAR